MRNFLGIELAEVFQVRNTHLSRCQKLYQLGVKILSCMGKTNNKGNANNIELQKIQLINSFELIREFENSKIYFLSIQNRRRRRRRDVLFL